MTLRVVEYFRAAPFSAGFALLEDESGHLFWRWRNGYTRDFDYERFDSMGFFIKYLGTKADMSIYKEHGLGDFFSNINTAGEQPTVRIYQGGVELK